jgi:NADPH2:quinone reductase
MDNLDIRITDCMNQPVYWLQQRRREIILKAIVVTEFGGPDVMTFTEVDVPRLESHQVLIRVVATSVNYADIKARSGQKTIKKPPYIPGLDAAGIIEAVGESVRNLQVGQRVIAFPHEGSHAEYIACDEALTFVIPDGVDFEVAAAAPLVSFTSYKLLADVARLQQGETVLIHAAAGGVGTTASQLAKLLGAGSIIGMVGSEAKIETAMDAGCDHVVVYDDTDFSEKINELTNGQGVDVVLDSIAGDVSQISMKCLAFYGRLVQFGNASGAAAHFRSSDLHASCRSVLGFSLNTTRRERPHLLRDTASHVLSYLADRKLDIRIGQRFQLKDVAEAHRQVESRKTVGKTLLYVTDLRL